MNPFKEDYVTKFAISYLVTESAYLPVCLICETQFSTWKSSNFARHCEKQHQNTFDEVQILVSDMFDIFLYKSYKPF